MGLIIDDSQRFDLTIRYRETGAEPTETTSNVNHTELIANLRMHRVPLLTCFQRRGVVQMSGGPQLIWKPAEETA